MWMGGRLPLRVRFHWQNWFRIDLHDVLNTSDELVSPLLFGQQDQAEAAHGGPEYGAQTSYKCQSQSDGSRKAEHLHDQHVPALVGSDVSGVKCACDIYELGQSLNCERPEHTDLGAQEPEDQIHFEHR